jgi:hypothetical protein
MSPITRDIRIASIYIVLMVVFVIFRDIRVDSDGILANSAVVSLKVVTFMHSARVGFVHIGIGTGFLLFRLLAVLRSLVIVIGLVMELPDCTVVEMSISLRLALFVMQIYIW